MFVLREKRCSTATHTISGGADVVKPFTSHDIQYERTGNILLAKGVGIRLNDAQSNGKPQRNKTIMTNKTQPSDH